MQILLRSSLPPLSSMMVEPDVSVVERDATKDMVPLENRREDLRGYYFEMLSRQDQ